MCITPSIWPHSGGLKKNCENVLELYIYIAFLPRKNETLLVKNYPLWIYFRNIFHRGEQAVMEFCWFETRKKESTKSVTRSGTQVRNRNLAEVAEEISWRPLWDWKSIPKKVLKNHETISYFLQLRRRKKALLSNVPIICAVGDKFAKYSITWSPPKSEQTCWLQRSTKEWTNLVVPKVI